MAAPAPDLAQPPPRDTSPPDFTSSRGFVVSTAEKRRSFLIMPDHLLILSHGYLKDQIERVGYDRMDYTVLRMSFPLFRAIVWNTLWGGAALVLLLLAAVKKEWGFLIPFTIVLIPLAFCIIRAVLMRQVELTLMRGGIPKVMKLYTSRKKIEQAYEKLTEAIRGEQARLTATAAGVSLRT